LRPADEPGGPFLGKGAGSKTSKIKPGKTGTPGEKGEQDPEGNSESRSKSKSVTHERPKIDGRPISRSTALISNPAWLRSRSAGPTRVAIMTSCRPCSDTSHGRLVDAWTDWILERTDHLLASDQGPPLVVPLTVTFSVRSIRPDLVLREYERFYARLCRLLIKNYERPSKRHLLPFAIAFRDDPSTRPDKYRERPSSLAILSNHPTVAPHVHSVLVVHPSLADRFLEIAPSLESVWRRIPVRTAGPSTFCAPTYANRTLRADVLFALEIRELVRADPVGDRSLVRTRIRSLVEYCAKLGRRRDVVDEDDLFVVLPPEPGVGDFRFGSVSGLEPDVVTCPLSAIKS
jgi:hypothetical protein